MNQKDVWKKYITAQSKILEHKSRPIGIDTTKSVQLNGLKLYLSIDQEIFKQVFKKEVEHIFNVQNFDFESGYIQTSVASTTNITFERLSKLKELAEICYIDFNENPVIEGTITGQENNSKEELKNIIGELPTSYHFKNSGLIFLTLDEWNRARQIQGLKFNKKIGAVFSIKPSLSFLISTFYRNIEIAQQGNKITVEGELHQNVYQVFEKHFGLAKRGNELTFTFENKDVLKRRIDELESKGITLPQPKENCLHFNYDSKFYEQHESDLGFEAFRLKRALKKYFPDNPFVFYYKTEYAFDFRKLDKGIDELERNEDVFWNRFFSEIHGDEFQVSQTHRTISFDFETESNLIEKLNYIKSFSFFDIYDRGDSHKFKFNIRFETGLHELQSNLKKEFPNLNTKLIANGEKLIFRQFYQTGNKTEILARLNNQLSDFIDSESFIYTINDTFQEKYLCEENFELKVEQEQDKLSKLLREEFYFGNPKEKYYLGKLQKVDYPDLYFVVDEDRIEEVKENISEEKVKAIFPDLKGEKDKIKRLEDTVLKLDDEKTKLPNDNAKIFLYDSSKAKIIENIDYLLNKTSAEWQDFENNLFSKSLNESQRQAIFKSLYADELALIQGPPGTGKSTAIAEIIWQHIRKEPKQKILLTSETNLAVDNAIDRLKNGQNNVVKPIRFGNTDNLESEGYFFSLGAIENWQKSNSNESNTVSHWVSNIANRVEYQEDELINSALDKWKTHLQKPNYETKKLFAEKYLEYVNLIGATGSSIGKLNSENKWTSFFRSYLNVFEKKHFENKNYDVLNRTKISFDTVIMDEASKATPPELALPVLFGKKSIIVGDHRQLPPMIDGEEIKDLLMSIGEKALAKTLSHKEFEISQFERLFKNIDESIKGTFDTQYRMHPAINEAISQFYKDDGGLKCGLPLEETYHNSFDEWDSRYHGLQYKNILTPETHTIWVNVTTPEIQEGTSRVNFGEIESIDNILTVLNNSKGKNEFDQWLSNKSLEEKQIGLISFYGKQIHYINKMLKEKHSEVPIRLSTVDRFQGMERNIIIVSMVRSNKLASFQGQQPDEIYGELGYPLQESLGFAESPNRLNVALSRARRLLIVVGNSEHFCRKDIYKNVFETIQQKGKIISAEELQNAVDQNG
ncbi:Superfamily I DNA and/or RNA helicase [Cyclobacterium xiamenense]|uniref:Superfamily I DNA and/or RNA helicase n=1 Tax=Cyclobacterium xiamenense TaxID=1297121 RepID=A0A1H6ZSY4_9BACT|nr:AAA domain-containing protein [Cyclobacterium xiamenense]SEJ56461.1 Superfamily I DNA and/or RNA helicase [Cyclobacterium xiamenense]